MINVQKAGVCLFISCFSFVCNADDTSINEDVEKEDLQEIDEPEVNNDNKKEKENKKSEGTFSGWYSGLDIKYVSSKLNVSEEKKNKTKEHNINGKSISPSLILGYDFLLNKLLMCGGEVNVAYNIGSPIDYKINDKEIANVTKGIAYAGSIKIGLNLGSVLIYGKVGGDLSKWKYNWKSEEKNNIEKQYKTSFLYGGGIEKQFKNNCYVRAEFSRGPNITHENTNKKIENSNISDIKTNNYQVSIGGGYRF